MEVSGSRDLCYTKRNTVDLCPHTLIKLWNRAHGIGGGDWRIYLERGMEGSLGILWAIILSTTTIIPCPRIWWGAVQKKEIDSRLQEMIISITRLTFPKFFVLFFTEVSEEKTWRDWDVMVNFLWKKSTGLLASSTIFSGGHLFCLLLSGRAFKGTSQNARL